MERAIPILPTDDLAVAKSFYVDGLGFRVTFEASEDGRTGLLGLERGTIQLTLDSPMDGHGRNACVSLHVDDADAYYREWAPKSRYGARHKTRIGAHAHSTCLTPPATPSSSWDRSPQVASNAVGFRDVAADATSPETELANQKLTNSLARDGFA